MNQDNKIVFRSALNGYNKADVNAYLAEVSKEYERREDEWAREAEKYEQALANLAKDKENLLEKYKKLTTDHDILEAEKRKAEVELSRLIHTQDKPTTDALESELSMQKAKLASANTILNSQQETAIKQKKHLESLAAELTALKQKLAERNTEIDALKKSLSASEQTSMERYAEISKQNGILEGYASQIELMKTELEAKNKLLESFNKTGNSGTERTVTEMRTEMDKFISSFDEKLETKLAGLAVQTAQPEKAEEVKAPEQEPKAKPAEEAPKAKASEKKLHKKIDSFFGT